jgi:hypothetical protein
VFKFDFTIRNPNDIPVYVVSIGLKNEPLSPRHCKGYTRLKIPFADYVIEYDINTSDETIVKADPIIRIEKNEVKRVSISALPIAAGYCDQWATKVSAFLRLDDGQRINSDSHTITSRDARQFAINTPSDQTIVDALEHRHPQLRIQGIEQLVGSTIDTKSKEILLKHKLNDPDQYVRMAAERAAGAAHLNGLVPDLISVARKARKQSEEETAALDGLGLLRDARAIDLFIEKQKLICDPYLSAIGCAPAVAGLIDVQHPSASEKCGRNVEQFMAGGTSVEKVEEFEPKFREYGCLKVIVHYDWGAGTGILRKILQSNRYRGLQAPVLEYMVRQYSAYGSDGDVVPVKRTVTHSVILNNRDEFRKRIDSQDALVRTNALFLWLISSDGSDASKVESAIGVSLSDPEANVRALAAQFAGIFKVKKYAQPIKALYDKKTDLWERNAYCRALLDLGEINKCLP